MMNKQLTNLYREFSTVLEHTDMLTKSIKHEEYIQVVEDMKFHLQSPYMFVIVGEVKAGKSSFINALLQAEQDICAVAPSPMTDTIQQIVYGSEKSISELNPYLKRIFYPEEILKEISIVDTPGTNTIVDHHQEITERFIPHADLIVFVFEAKNPYRQSAWEFFDYINDEWRKKIIFVLQQKDLMQENDLIINIQGVKDQAINKGIQDPQVFAVSAKQEQEGLVEESGFMPLRSYLNEVILNGRAPFLKLENNLDTTNALVEKIGNSLTLRKNQFESDKLFRKDITTTLENQEIKTNRQIDILTENLIAGYDKITQEKIDSLSQGLSFFPVLKRSFSSVLGGDQSLKDWLQNQAKDFELKLNNTLKNKLQDGITDVADDIQLMGKMVNAKISNSKNILQDSDEIFSDIAEKRANVLSDLQKSFRDFMNDSDNFYDDELLSQSGSMAPNLAAGGGIAVVGVILSTVVNGAVFDITGGILTTIGVLFAGVSLGWKRKKVLNQFKHEIARGREKLESEVSETLKNYAARIKSRIDRNFFNLDQLLEKEANELKTLDGLQTSIKSKLAHISTEAKKIN